MNEEPSGHSSVSLDGRSLSLQQIEQIARDRATVSLSDSTLDNIRAGLQVVAHYVDSGTPGYGINTGVGSLSDRTISAHQIHDLQENLLNSHASGTGDRFPDEVVRAAMAIRSNSLALGHSGVRPEVIESILTLLNNNLIPCVPDQGSLGASGDLAPLAHMALPLIGLGTVASDGVVLDSAHALAQNNIVRLKLEAKEALALMNGTQFISALATLALLDAERLLQSAISVSALSMTALGALQTPFDSRLHAIRPHPGQVNVAHTLRWLLSNSSDAYGKRMTARVQDPYSIRCIPQVFGGIEEALAPLRSSLEIEINSATDNPLVFFEDNAVISGGNFHGHPLALKIDAAKIAIASLGTVNERRISLLVDGVDHGLPRFLVTEPGINSGFMLAHYLTAGLVAENRILSHPASVDSIPTSANIEDYNSMGTIAARHFRQIVHNVEKILAVEALCAAQACDLVGIVPTGPLGSVYASIREAATFMETDDRIISTDIDRTTLQIKKGALIAVPELEREPQ